MGLISGVLAIREVKKIRMGKKGKLSISQITGLITNMLDAKNNLDREDFNNVYALFSKFSKIRTKMLMDRNDYLEACMSIIKEFDKVAPYDKYSGSDDFELSFLLNEVRNNNQNEESIYSKFFN